MSNKLVDIKEVAIKNNCPECFSTERLRLKFQQKTKESKFYKSITNEIESMLNCETCNSIIYPVQWTNDIERVVAYHKKAVTPMTPSTSLKKISWLVLLGILSLFIIAAVITVYSGK